MIPQGGERVRLIFEGTAEEAAALVLAIQERRTEEDIKRLAKEEIFELYGVKASDIPSYENPSDESS